jgi:PAS domain S-box-containing protein
MVVDDEEHILSLFRMVLEKEGYQVVCASSGEECLKRIKKETPHLILLDIMMPGMSGIEVMERARNLSPDTIIIVVTAHASIDSAVSAIRYGAGGYILKPFDVSEVIAVVKKALRERELEAKLRKSEEKYRCLFENANDAILLISPKDGHILEVNNRAREFTGYSKEELESKCFRDICASRKICSIMENFPQQGRVQSEVFYEVSFIRKNREIVLGDISAGLVEFGGKESILCIVRDITEKKKSEEEIRRLKEFNEKIVQGLQEGVLMEDSQGRIIFANPRMIEMLGYTRDELLGRHLSAFVAPDYSKKIELMKEKMSDGRRSRYEAVMMSKKGKEIPVVISTTPMFEKGVFKGGLAVITDISAIKKEEDEMSRRVMKYRVSRGNAYLVKEKELEKGLDVLSDLLNAGYNGLIITRTPPTKMKDMCAEDVPVVWLSEKRYDKMTIPPNFFLIEKTIENYLNRNRVVLLDRLDYLILKNGFKKTMEFIQRLCEMFFINKAILILSMDPKILDEKERRLLDKEVAELRLKHEAEFPEDLYEILEYVFRQNSIGKKPAHKEIENKFGITRTTARKRINRLKALGLIEDRKWGKYKILKITERGKVYF